VLKVRFITIESNMLAPFPAKVDIKDMSASCYLIG
jgi:hypothetical protein